jgi:hypothetical protein
MDANGTENNARPSCPICGGSYQGMPTEGPCWRCGHTFRKADAEASSLSGIRQDMQEADLFLLPGRGKTIPGYRPSRPRKPQRRRELEA